MQSRVLAHALRQLLQAFECLIRIGRQVIGLGIAEDALIGDRVGCIALGEQQLPEGREIVVCLGDLDTAVTVIGGYNIKVGTIARGVFRWMLSEF